MQNNLDIGMVEKAAIFIIALGHDLLARDKGTVVTLFGAKIIDVYAKDGGLEAV